MIRRAMLATACVLAATPAAAQMLEQSGKARPATIADEGGYSGAKARLVMEGFARCVVARHRAAVYRAIALPPMSADETKAMAKLVDDDCLRGGSMNFSSVHFRGGLYTALYRERFRGKMGTLRAEPVDFAAGVTAAPGSPTAQAVSTLQFVDCAVRRRPEAAHRVIVGTAGSAEENAGFSALIGDFTTCVATESRIRFSRTQLEGVIAEVLYRDMVESPAVGAGK